MTTCCYKTCGRQGFSYRYSPSPAGPASRTPGTCAPCRTAHSVLGHRDHVAAAPENTLHQHMPSSVHQVHARCTTACADRGWSPAPGQQAVQVEPSSQYCCRGSQLHVVDGIKPVVPALEHVALSVRSSRPAWHSLCSTQHHKGESKTLACQRHTYSIGGEDKGLQTRVLPQLGHIQPIGVPSQLHVGPTRSTSEVRRLVNSLCQATLPCKMQERVKEAPVR